MTRPKSSRPPRAAARIMEPLRAELARLFPEPKTALNYETPLQLAIAVILSAQCTDARVNLVTPALFAKYRTVDDFAKADLRELESYVKSTGFYRNKAKNIQAFCKALLTHHNGNIPTKLDQLTELPGVGRKTANVILGDAFGIPGITVDTHVGRLSRRLGLSRHNDPEKVERDLQKLVPQGEWTLFSHRLILHGRATCAARKPKCSSCSLAEICPQVGVKSKSPPAKAPSTKRG